MLARAGDQQHADGVEAEAGGEHDADRGEAFRVGGVVGLVRLHDLVEVDLLPIRVDPGHLQRGRGRGQRLGGEFAL